MSAYWYFTTSSLLFHVIAALSFLWRPPAAARGTPSFVTLLPTLLAAASLSAGCIYTLYHFLTLPSWLMLLSTALTWLTMLGCVLFRMKMMVLITAPLCILMICGDMIHRSPHDTEISFLRDLHILTAILGQATAIISCVISLLLLWQQKGLKQKPMNLMHLSQTPSLQKLLQLLAVSLYISVVLFSLALLSGISYASTLPFTDISLELRSKVVWALSVWGFYLYLLFLKDLYDISPARLAKLSVWGGGVLSLTFLMISAI